MVRIARQGILLFIGVLVGALLTGIGLTQMGARAVEPPAAQGETLPDVTATISPDLFAREANRRVAGTLTRYNLRDPQWGLNDDNSIVLSSTGKLPILGSDVDIDIVLQPKLRDGALTMEIVRIEYGQVRVSGSPFNGLIEGLNQQLGDLIDREKFEIQRVAVTSRGITFDLRVIGDLSDGIG